MGAVCSGLTIPLMLAFLLPICSLMVRPSLVAVIVLVLASNTSFKPSFSKIGRMGTRMECPSFRGALVVVRLSFCWSIWTEMGFSAADADKLIALDKVSTAINPGSIFICGKSPF
ncbi:hypothetical protein D3C74_367600 [compost metagenome]